MYINYIKVVKYLSKLNWIKFVKVKEKPLQNKLV